MHIDGLVQLYTKRFIEEFGEPHIQERKYLLNEDDPIVGDDGTQFFLVNGEFGLSPYETWSAHVDDVAYAASKKSQAKVSYEWTRDFLLQENPNVTTRDYKSQEEYEYTVETLFDGILMGMRVGRLEDRFMKTMEEEEEKCSQLKWFFKKGSVKKKVIASLEEDAQRIKRTSREYYYMNAPSFLRECSVDYNLIEEI